MNFIDLVGINYDKQNEFNEKIADLNMQKAEQISLLSSFLANNKDIFHGAYSFDLNSISDASQLNGEFDYWIRSLRDVRIGTEREKNLNNVLNNFYVKLTDIYNKINEVNRGYAQYMSEQKNNIKVEGVRTAVEYINSITEISNRIGEKRNKIDVIINYMKNIDTEDFMKNDHRMMVETLKNEINIDMTEICNLVSSRFDNIDNYCAFRSNIRRNVAILGDTSLTLDNVSYDVMYKEHEALSDMLISSRRPVNVPQTEEIHNEQTSIPSEEPSYEMPPINYNTVENNSANDVIESSDEQNPSNDDIPVEDENLDDSLLEDSSLDDNLDEEEEREPVKNSPLSQFRDKFKHRVKGISTANSKLKEKIDAKTFRKSALRWTGVVVVLAVAAAINPALLLGGAAVGAGIYEYNVAKKMK